MLHPDIQASGQPCAMAALLPANVFPYAYCMGGNLYPSHYTEMKLYSLHNSHMKQQAGASYVLIIHSVSAT
jgi:hypothetical protein